MTKTIENTSTIYTGKFNNPEECVYYMQMTGMSLGDFLKDCANRAKEHYFDTVTGKDLKGLEDSIRENCELLGELTDCDALEELGDVVGDEVKYENRYCDDDSCPVDERPEYDDSDFEYYDALEDAGYANEVNPDDDFGFSWVEYHIN